MAIPSKSVNVGALITLAALALYISEFRPMNWTVP